MARIVKRKVQHGKPYEVRWSWYTDDGQRRFGQERFTTLAEAKAKKAEIETKAVDGALTDHTKGREQFASVAERWFRAHQVGLKPSTTRSYRDLLDRTVLPTFGSRRIRAVQTADVQDFVLSLHERGMAPPTIRHHYNALRQVLQFAVEERAIPYNPAQFVKLPTDKSTGRLKPEMGFLSPDQVAVLASKLDPPYDLLTLFMAYTGLRAGEVAGLNVGDLDLLRDRVIVRRTRRKIKGGWEVHTPKSGKERRVPLPGWLAEDLRTYLAAHPHNDVPGAPLWPGRVNGGVVRFSGGKGSFTYDEPWEPGHYRRQFKAALPLAGLPATLRLHDLRHTFASICNSLEIPAAHVAEWMGHANEGITRTIYTHLFESDSAAFTARLARPALASSNVRELRREA
jgi:integrase